MGRTFDAAMSGMDDREADGPWAVQNSSIGK